MASLLEEFERSWLTSLIGICLFFAGTWVLTWNEGRAVHHAHSVDEVYNKVISLNPYDLVQPEFDDNIVHISAHLIIDEPLTEPDYGISIQAVKLKRRVQMYQWVEERSPRDYGDNMNQEIDTNDYYYVTEWKDKIIDSSNFYIRHGHQNPKEIPLKSKVYIAPSVNVGNLKLSTEIKEKFTEYIEVTSDERPEFNDVKLHMGIYYHCTDIWNPQVGDIRVQFYYAGLSGEQVTIIAQQKNGVLYPYKTSKGHKIAFLRQGSLNVNQMFQAEHYDAQLEVWKYRGAGAFVIYAASICLSKLIKILFSRSASFNSFVSQEGTGHLILSLSVSILIISFAWMCYRPMFGAQLLFFSISPFLYCAGSFFNELQNRLFRR